MSVPAQVFVDPDDVASQLAMLGLGVVPLHRAVQSGYLAKAGCTSNDPVSYPGTTFWARTMRGLRDLLLPEGWTKTDEDGYSLVVSPDESMAVAVATGDDATGIPTRTPKTNRPKGPATAAAVQANAQIELFDAREVVKLPTSVSSARATWVLLIKDITVDDRHFVRSELSLPAIVGDDGRIEDWHRRLILPEMVDDDDRAAQQPADPGPDFDVDVRRRIG